MVIVCVHCSESMYTGCIYIHVYVKYTSIFSFTVAGEDFDGSPVEAVFPITAMLGDLACVDIPIIDDMALECSQEFTVDIIGATLGTTFVGLQSEATVVITDNDGRLNELESWLNALPGHPLHYI